jgi:hypothetical protein
MGGQRIDFRALFMLILGIPILLIIIGVIIGKIIGSKLPIKVNMAIGIISIIICIFLIIFSERLDYDFFSSIYLSIFTLSLGISTIHKTIKRFK